MGTKEKEIYGVELAALLAVKEFCGQLRLYFEGCGGVNISHVVKAPVAKVSVKLVGVANFNLSLWATGPYGVTDKVKIELLTKELVPGFTSREAVFQIGPPHSPDYRLIPINGYDVHGVLKAEDEGWSPPMGDYTTWRESHVPIVHDPFA